MLNALTFPRLVALAAAGSAGILGGALMFQALGFAPCELCILQRWPHLAAALLGAGLLSGLVPGGWRRPLAAFGGLLMLGSAGLGGYHSGVERHLFAGPDSCTSAPLTALSAQDLLTQISAAPLVRCDEIVWDLFGITMPNFNTLFSLAFALLWLAAARTARHG